MKPVETAVTNLVSIEELDQNILDLCTRINVATYELLVMIREFEERAGFLKWGLGNCAEWLAWRCDLSMTTAREKVRVARALRELPLIGALSPSPSNVQSGHATGDAACFLDRWYFVRPDGIAVPDRGYHCRDTIHGDVSTLHENPPAGGLLSTAEKLLREPPPPVYFH